MKAQEINSVSDDALMLEVSNGEVRRLGLLFDRYHRKLFDFFIRMTGSREISEDLVQDVFFRILKYRGTFRPGSRFTVWMYTSPGTLGSTISTSTNASITSRTISLRR